jgi:glutathione S-transferase
VADARYSGAPDLVLLCVATDRLTAPLRDEVSDAGEETFPHLYGTLNLDAVVAVVPFPEGPSGFTLPAEVTPRMAR